LPGLFSVARPAGRLAEKFTLRFWPINTAFFLLPRFWRSRRRAAAKRKQFFRILVILLRELAFHFAVLAGIV